MVFAHRNFLTDAFVSLDGTISYNMDQLLEAYPQLPVGKSVNVPALIAVGLNRSENATPIDRSHYFELVDRADVYHADYQHLPHWGFSSMLIDRNVRASATSSEPGPAQNIRRSYEVMLDDVREFLDAYVKSDSRDPQWAESALHIVAARRNGLALPSFDDFSRAAFDDGPEAAMSLYRETNKTASEHRMFNAWSLNRIMAEYIMRGDYALAIMFSEFALSQYEDRPFLYVTVARAYWISAHSEKALRALDAALELAPEDQSALALKARITENPDFLIESGLRANR